MASELSRRGFLRGSALVAGAVASGTVIPFDAAVGSMTSAKLLYGPAPGMAKLNANENPYGPSKKALAAMSEASAKGAYYVGESVTRLIDMIAERYGVTKDWITLSAGSSGVLTYLAVAKAKQGKILGPDLFWDTTTLGAIRQGGELVRTPKAKDLTISLDDLYASITPDVSMVQICNPNNPTGMTLDPRALKAFCMKASKKATVLIDEAYNEITDDPDAHTMIGLVKDGYDVVVARTFSKIYGLAGMRVGYMIAKPETTELVQKYSLGNYSLNQAGVAAALATYDDFDFLKYSKSMILEARGMLEDAVQSNGLSAAPSNASFMFVDLGSLNAEMFRQKMALQDVYIRGIYRDYTNWSRVSCGMLPDVQKYVTALPKVLDAMNA
ncbi:MAG: aminotransferase class I/II-fold pyridoxal phosphate-dependent enzyme [Pseudomonadales bacterium]|nr:aminotransferase class I/II-fold pyridoxal phosphate-dependent enzyme [Pseudomonadales bacterium]